MAPAAQRRGRRAPVVATVPLIYLLILFGAFYLGVLWRDYAIPFLVDRGYRPLAIGVPGAVAAGLMLVLR
jgi:hypothetical protein